MTTTTNDQPPVRRRRIRHPGLPKVGQIEALISQARALRLEFVKLGVHEMLAEPAREGVEALSKTGLHLERIIELTAAAGNRRRRRSTTNKPVTTT